MKKYIVFIIIVAVAVCVFWYYWSNKAQAPEVMTKDDLIEVSLPIKDSEISSPVKVIGKARGNWYFEASFPIFIVDWDGKIIGQGIAQAQGDWMTTEYVPFTAEITFEKPTYKNTGAIILKKDNPSGLPEHDNALEYTIRFK